MSPGTDCPVWRVHQGDSILAPDPALAGTLHLPGATFFARNT